MSTVVLQLQAAANTGSSGLVLHDACGNDRVHIDFQIEDLVSRLTQIVNDNAWGCTGSGPGCNANQAHV